MRENLWLRKMLIAAGDRCDVGARLALFSTEAEEPLDGAPAREVRIMTAGINFHEEMWSGTIA
jgi:hypothetical protein